MISTPDKPVRKILLLGIAVFMLGFPAFADQGQHIVQLDSAREELRRGDGIAAEVSLRRALAEGIPRQNVAALMGESQLRQGNIREARRWLEPAEFSSDQRGLGFRMLGRLEMADGDLAAAGRALDLALQEDPDDVELWVDIGRLRYRGGEHIQAIEAAAHALKLGPSNPRALEFCAQLLRDSKGPVAALPLFAAALKIEPNDIGLLGEYAATLGEAGRAKQMLDVTRQMIELDPHDPRPFYLQAVLAARAGNDNLASRLLWRIDDADLESPAALMLRGVLDLRNGNYVSAGARLEELWRLQPDNARAAILVARLLAETGRNRELVERFDALALRADASPYLLTLVGRAYEAQGNRARAAIFLDRAAVFSGDLQLFSIPQNLDVAVLEARWRDAPGQPDRVIPLVRQYLALGRHSDAAALVGNLREKFPGSSDVQFLAGDVFLASGRAAAARDAYKLAAQVRLSRPLVFRLVAAHLALGDHAAAEQALSGYFSGHPMDGTAAAQLGELAAHSGDWQRALYLYANAARQGGGERNPRLDAQSALANIGIGKAKAAIANAADAYRLQRASGRTAYIFGLALKANGSDRAAEPLLTKAHNMSADTGNPS
jgi:cellulose synthase operon protein C